MGRFQLVFSETGSKGSGRATTTWTASLRSTAGGSLTEVQVIQGVAWLLTADHIGDTKTFLCTLVAEAADD